MTNMLSETVRVARRFTRSIRVDTDLSDPAALEGFICSQSAADALLIMGRHREATSHGAFTWTGPYGSGKSSLAVALAAVLAGPTKAASKLFAGASLDDTAEIIRLFRPTAKPWSIVPVVGQRADATSVLRSAIETALGEERLPRREPSEGFAAWLGRAAKAAPSEGIVLLIDEMGKFLEHSAIDGGDVHVFQEIAEIAARSQGRLIVVGILHQAFDEYAHRMSREARDEWLKVQGRFLDISISLAGEEQIELISRAIESNGKPRTSGPAARIVAKTIRGARSGPLEPLEDRLTACWPLHPVVAALLGPISRRRFGQSQRSIFGFLTSAEPFGFQEFLTTTPPNGALFSPKRLWDYLRSNLEPAILASPDGHRWSTAVDAVERCEARGGTPSHLRVLKAIALLDLFKDRSGLQPTPEIAASCATVDEAAFMRIIDDLLSWSVIVFRKHAGAYAIYAGSDFDIEQAVDKARQAGVVVDYRLLARQAALQPILAKRHYETTGALRWFEIDLAPLHEAEERVRAYRPAAGAAGLFLLLVSANGEPQNAARRIIKAVSESAGDRLVVVGWTRDSFRLRDMASELTALEHVRANRPELEGDAIARREIDARISRLSADLEDRLGEAIDVVDWRLPTGANLSTHSQLTGPAALSILASRLADWRYPETPRLRNELVNRTRPSSNAAAATRALLKAMVEKSGEPRLAMQGYPPEAGLFVSLLESTGLYAPDGEGVYRFQSPAADDDHRLSPLWEAGEALLKASAKGCSLSELFALWRAPPFGVRDGLLSILGVTFLLTRADRAAIYLEDVFRPQLDSFLVDRILQDPSAVRVRLVELSDLDANLISELARRLATEEAWVEPSALDVARALVKNVRALPSWTTRTATLSKAALALRNLGNTSHDPNQLLFEDLPRAVGDGSNNQGALLAIAVDGARRELEDAYPKMLADLAKTLMTELRFKGAATKDYGPLHRRAANVRGLSGNFRLDALATRLSTFEGSLEEIEGIASLAANKPSRDWVDRDVDAAKIELAALAQQFLRAEGFGHLKGRTDGRVTMVVYMSDPSYPEPVTSEIQLDPAERQKAEELYLKLAALVGREGAADNVALGALAKLGLSLNADQTAVAAKRDRV
jgi:hypothetical protein